MFKARCAPTRYSARRPMLRLKALNGDGTTDASGGEYPIDRDVHVRDVLEALPMLAAAGFHEQSPAVLSDKFLSHSESFDPKLRPCNQTL